MSVRALLMVAMLVPNLTLANLNCNVQCAYAGPNLAPVMHKARWVTIPEGSGVGEYVASIKKYACETDEWLEVLAGFGYSVDLDETKLTCVSGQ